MKKKVVAFVLVLMMTASMFVISHAEETSAVTDVTLADAGLTMEDIQEAGRYYKSASESGAIDGWESEYRFALAAASLGSGDAMLWLGELFQGDKIEAAHEADDPVAIAMEWWEKAANYGQPRGLANIGLLYRHESVPGGGPAYGNVEYDEVKAFEYFVKSAENGDSKAPRYVGLAYQDGIGVEVDEAKAFEFFELAAERNDSTGKYLYAMYLLQGKSCDQDVEKAIALLDEQVVNKEHELTKCALALGDIYAEGSYIEANAEKAAEYYEIVKENAKEDSEEYAQAVAALEKL